MPTERQLDDWIDGFLLYTDQTESPESFRRWVAISVLAGCLERKCFLSWEGLLYPNFYVILVGPPAARKGTAMKFGRIFLDMAGVHLSAESTTREGLIRELNLSHAPVSDGAQTTFHRSLTIYSEELAVFLSQKDPRIMRDLADWFDCRDTWKYMPKDRKLQDQMENVFVNLCGAITPDLIRYAMPQEAVGGGLLSRMIFIYEEKKGKIIPVPGRTEAEDALFVRLKNDLHTITQIKGEYKTDKAFLDEWVPWVFEHEANMPFQGTLLQYYAERKRIHVLKLSMICSASRHSEKMIRLEDFHRALGIINDAEEDMLKAFSGYGESDIANLVARAIAVLAEENVMTFSRMMQLFHADADVLTMERVLRTLIAMKKCVTDRNDKGEVIITYKMESEL